MTKSVFPMWLFAVVAAAIAMIAFGLAQIGRGAGMVFVIGAAFLWTTHVVGRGRGMRGDV